MRHNLQMSASGQAEAYLRPPQPAYRHYHCTIACAFRQRRVLEFFCAAKPGLDVCMPFFLFGGMGRISGKKYIWLGHVVSWFPIRWAVCHPCRVGAKCCVFVAALLWANYCHGCVLWAYAYGRARLLYARLSRKTSHAILVIVPLLYPLHVHTRVLLQTLVRVEAFTRVDGDLMLDVFYGQAPRHQSDIV